jgi:hypothetical protein
MSLDFNIRNLLSSRCDKTSSGFSVQHISMSAECVAGQGEIEDETRRMVIRAKKHVKADKGTGQQEWTASFPGAFAWRLQVPDPMQRHSVIIRQHAGDVWSSENTTLNQKIQKRIIQTSNGRTSSFKSGSRTQQRTKSVLVAKSRQTLFGQIRISS